MAQTAKKVNFMINDDLKREFEEMIPPGQRSKVVNEALRKELLAIKRRKLTEKLLSLRGKNVRPSSEILEALRKDRGRNV
jgi:metal-responsive CopG/Arc/MetJ family transcriptional regulator